MFFEIITLIVVVTAFIAILLNLGKKLSKNEPTETLDSPDSANLSNAEDKEQREKTELGIKTKLQNISQKNKTQPKSNQKMDETNNELLIKEARKSYERALGFMKTAKGFSNLGILNEKTIFRYLYTKGYLYEFFDTLSENNQRKEMTEDIFAWDRLFYKRVVNPIHFYENHAQELLNL